MDDYDQHLKAHYDLATNRTLVLTGGTTQIVSIRKSIELEINEYERLLEVKKEMLKLLDENPAIEGFMDLSRGYR